MVDEFKISGPPEINVIPESLTAQPAPSGTPQPSPIQPSPEPPKARMYIGKKPIIAAAATLIIIIAALGIFYSGALQKHSAATSTIIPTTVATTTGSSTSSTTSSSTTTTSIIPKLQVNFYITVKDSNDTYARYMRLFIDQKPGQYLGSGLYQNSTNSSVIINSSVGKIGLPTQLVRGTHRAYLILSQSGGPSYGTYSGNVMVEELLGGGAHVNSTFNVSGITAIRPSNFTFNVI